MSNAWNNVDVSVSTGKYFKLIEGPNKCRIVSEPLVVYKHFDKQAGITEVYLTEEASKSRPKCARRFMFWVIDRADGALKQAEFGVQIMSQLKDIAIDPEYKVDGPVWPRDISINRKGTGPLDTEYSVLPSPKEVGLTVDEMKLATEAEPLLDVVKKDAMDSDRV